MSTRVFAAASVWRRVYCSKKRTALANASVVWGKNALHVAPPQNQRAESEH